MSEDKTQLGSKKSLFTEVTSILAVVASLFGLFVGYKKLIEERPNLIVQIERVSLNGYVHPDTIIYNLEEIEQLYGLTTGDKILQMKEKIKKLNRDFLDSTAVVSIISSLYDNIRFFQMPPPKPWSFNEIAYSDGVITWPDGATYNTKADDNSKTILGTPTDSMSLINLKKSAYSLYQPFEKQDREAIANRLRVVRSKLNRLADQPSHFLEVHLRVINKSTQPNILMRSAGYSITASNNENEKTDKITLVFSNESVVGGLSEARMTLRSKVSSQLKPVINLHEIFTRRKDIVTELALTDVENNGWKAKSQLEVTNGQAEIVEIKN